MSSFDGRSKIFLFDLRNGKKKLAYGLDRDDALNTLASRLSPAEMAEILVDQYRIIKQTELPGVVPSLG